jgi:hypothetical protein
MFEEGMKGKRWEKVWEDGKVGDRLSMHEQA